MSNPAATGSRFLDQGDGTVIDTTTGLMWMRPLLGQTIDADGNVVGKSEEMTFDGAAKVAASTVFADHKDWRVPTIEELKTLSVPGIGINKQAFGEDSHGLWSSTPHARYFGYAYVFLVCSGTGSNYGGDCRWQVRLVRDVA